MFLLLIHGLAERLSVCQLSADLLFKRTRSIVFVLYPSLVQKIFIEYVFFLLSPPFVKSDIILDVGSGS
jgi:hypothetical protein